eukprot:4015498-Prymnesium_polylepis.1
MAALFVTAGQHACPRGADAAWRPRAPVTRERGRNRRRTPLQRRATRPQEGAATSGAVCRRVTRENESSGRAVEGRAPPTD